ncbi:ubiquinone oxidoreductase 20 kd subunit [Powellomyces hirtus]|nr:ubiquinone oxidoreductase 20 kd subunit [Powellomyces hirtus]
MLSATRTLVPRAARSVSVATRLMSNVAVATSSKVVPQAANRATVWSEHQQKKAVAMTGARFEQTDFDLQPNPLSAQELIAQVPVKMVSARRVACDGGGGALGHPKVYINLDRNEPESCGYCGLRFQQEHHHH